MSPAAVVRADGNAALGMGHLRRCLVLATALGYDGYEVRFVRRRQAGDGSDDICVDLPTIWLEETGPSDAATTDAVREVRDAEATLSVIRDARDERSWMVVDHYSLSRTWESRIRRSGWRILAIEDFRDRRHCADVLVSDSPEPFVGVLNHVESGGLQLAGFEYSLVDVACTAGDDSRGPREPSRLLVSFGGSDPTRETAKACHALASLQARRGLRLFGRVDVVVGPANPLRTELSHAIDGVADARMYVAPVSLVPLIRDSDLVITSGGNTMVEALALRKPCLVVLTADNQRSMTAELQARELVRVAGVHSAVGVSEIASAVETVLGELPALTARVRERSGIDHFGARRIVSAMRTIEHASRSTDPAVTG